MPEIKGIYIEDKRQDAINSELLTDYKNFEKDYDGYNKETAALGKKHLDKMRQKLNENRGKIIGYEELRKKFPEKTNAITNTYNKYEKEITEYTNKLGNRDYIKHHKETINKIGSIIDNYEKDVIEIIKELVEDMGDEEIKQNEKGKVEKTNEKVKYVNIEEDGIYNIH